MGEGGGTERHFQRGRERERVQAVSLSDGTAVDYAHGKAIESRIKLKVKMESRRKTSEPRSCFQTSFEGLEKVDRIAADTEALPLFLIFSIGITCVASNHTIYLV